MCMRVSGVLLDGPRKKTARSLVHTPLTEKRKESKLTHVYVLPPCEAILK